MPALTSQGVDRVCAHLHREGKAGDHFGPTASRLQVRAAAAELDARVTKLLTAVASAKVDALQRDWELVTKAPIRAFEAWVAASRAAVGAAAGQVFTNRQFARLLQAVLWRRLGDSRVRVREGK